MIYILFLLFTLFIFASLYLTYIHSENTDYNKFQTENLKLVKSRLLSEIERARARKQYGKMGTLSQKLIVVNDALNKQLGLNADPTPALTLIVNEEMNQAENTKQVNAV